MTEEKEIFENYTDFLSNDMFIKWRVLQTDELNRFWAEFANNYPHKSDSLNLAIAVFDKIVRFDDSVSVLPEEVKDEFYKKIVSTAQLRQDIRRKKIKQIYYRAAAACIALLITASVFFIKQKEEFPEAGQVAGVTDVIIGAPIPSKDIRLISGGKVVEFEQNAQIALSEDGRAVISGENVKTTDMLLSKGVMNKLLVPSGKRSTIELSDGTKIWLNSGTELDFPAGFEGETRNIYVKGEIYIEVAKKVSQPFYVHTPKFDVLVHGTRFNISAYSNADNQSIVLVEGKVEINAIGYESTMLTPNEMLSIDGSILNKKKVDVSEYISWKDGILILNGKPLSEILKYIGRYYNVEFDDRSGQLSEKRCVGKLVLSDNIDDVMISLSAISSTVFYREDETIYLKPKSKTN